MSVLTAVAGGGNWTTAATWSPAQTPTAADDCIIAATSGAVTVNTGALCRSWTVQSGAGTTTHTAAVTLTIGDGTPGAGNVALSFPASGWTYTLGSATTSAITFVSTSATQQTVNFAGRATGNVIYNAASNGSWLCTGGQSGTGNTVTHTKGSLDFNGQTIAGGTFNSSNTNVRSLTLGAATFNLALWNLTNVTNLTFSGASATINTTGTFDGGGQTYGAVTITTATALLSGANTFTTLTLNGTSTKTSNVRITGTPQTIGTLIPVGFSVTARLLLTGNVVGTTATLNVGAISGAANLDLRDIISGGAADWNLASIPGNSGDCGGNSAGITFTPAATQTATGTASFTWSTHGWTSRVPLPQDDVVIPNAFIAGRTVTQDQPRAGKSISFLGATGTPTFAGTATAFTLYGSFTKIADMIQTGINAITFENRSPATITNAGVAWTAPLNVTCFGTTLTLLDAMASTSTFTHTSGNFIDAGFSTTFTTLTNNSGQVRTFTRTGSMTLTGTGAVATFASSNLTYTGTGATTTISETTQGTSKTFAGGGLTTFGGLVLSGKNIIITGANTFASLALNNLGDTTGVTLPAGVTTTVTGAFTSTASAGNVAKLISSISGTPATLSKSSGLISVDYVSIKDSAVVGGVKAYAGVNSVNVSGNTGWVFTVVPSFQVAWARRANQAPLGGGVV